MERGEIQLGYTGLYDTWMHGDKSLGIPNWTGFTIGYHIVNDYRRYRPGVSWETLTLTSATTIPREATTSPARNELTRRPASPPS